MEKMCTCRLIVDRSEVELVKALESRWNGARWETQPRDGTEEDPAGETPEDVAILYSWGRTFKAPSTAIFPPVAGSTVHRFGIARRSNFVWRP